MSQALSLTLDPAGNKSTLTPPPPTLLLFLSHGNYSSHSQSAKTTEETGFVHQLNTFLSAPSSVVVALAMSPAEGTAAGEGGSVKFIIRWPAAVHGTLVLWLLPLARPPPPPQLPPLLSVPWAVSGSSRFAIYMTLGALPFPSAAAGTLPRLYGHKGSSLERRTTGRDGTKWDRSSCSRNSCTCYFTFPHTTHTHTPNDSVADDSLLSFHLSTRSFIHSPLQDTTPEPPPPPPFIPPTTLPVAEDVIGPYEGVVLM